MNIRLTILLVFVLAIFGALALWFRPWAQDAPREEEPWAWRIDDDAIVHIEATHQGRTVVYEKDLGRGKWFIVDDGGVSGGGERQPVYHDKWAGTTLLLSGPKVNRVLSEAIENPAQYGLDPPESVIRITEETGRTYEFQLGNATPDAGYHYMRVEGSGQLFTIPEVWARVVNKLALEPPYVPPPIELGYFYDADFRNIQALEVTHMGVRVSYTPNPAERKWYASVDGGEPQAVRQPEWWTPQLSWFGKPGKPGGPDTPGGWLISETDAGNPEYGLNPPRTVVRITTHEAQHEFFIGEPHTEVDEAGQPILDDGGNAQTLVHYAGLPDDPIVYVINAVRARRTICLAAEPPLADGGDGGAYDCP